MESEVKTLRPKELTFPTRCPELRYIKRLHARVLVHIPRKNSMLRIAIKNSQICTLFCRWFTVGVVVYLYTTISTRCRCRHHRRLRCRRQCSVLLAG